MLGEKIASLRKQRGLSQYELADRLGFSRGKLANYEQGTRQPDYETLDKIASFFDVSMDFLLGRSTATPSEDFKVNEEKTEHSTNSPTDHFATWARSRVRSDYTPEELKKLENRVQSILKMFDEEIEQTRKKEK